MKKPILKVFVFILVLAALAVALNYPFTTRQGIDFEVRELKIPLYLKSLDFIDRYYNYGVLAERIVSGKKSDTEKAVAILKWTKENIRENPKSLPVVDDHTWHIIVRGYGTDDQFQDVFSTLCNRSGVGAFFSKVIPSGGGRMRNFSFVRLERGWAVFDAYHGIYFVNSGGEPAILDEIRAGGCKAARVSEDKGEGDYSIYFGALASTDNASWESSRAAIQSPVRRFLFWIKGGKKQAAGN